jgi:hypothetical protein
MAYNPNNINGQATMANSAPVVLSSDHSNVPVDISNSGMIDTFGRLMVSQQHNDIDIQFFRDDPNNTLTVTAAGGGTATQQPGYAQFATSTGTTGSIKGVSLDRTHYHSGGEIFSLFTVAWLDGGQATSFQRVGLFDNNDGIFIGYENTTFGVTIRTGAVDTQVAKTSFNVDTLVGGSTSKFTRGGVPEAIDLTKTNIFRIRFGWLGSAPISFEVLSPDGHWVLFHIVRQPNFSATPSIQTPDLPMTLEITKTAGATNIRMNSNCWGAGIQYDSGDWTETSSLGTAVNSIVEYNTAGLGSSSVYVATTTTGTMIFEATIDGKTWFTHAGVIDPNIGGTDLLVQGAVTPTAGSYYKIPITGFRSFRVRTATTLGATVALYFVGDTHDIFHDVTPAPHNIGFVQVHKDGEYTTAQTGTNLWVPTTGKKFVITDLTITTGGTTGGLVTLFQAASATTTFAAGTTPAIFRGNFFPSATVAPGVVKPFPVPYISTTADHTLHVTTSAAMTVYIQVNGYEI